MACCCCLPNGQILIEPQLMGEIMHFAPITTHTQQATARRVIHQIQERRLRVSIANYAIPHYNRQTHTGQQTQTNVHRVHFTHRYFSIARAVLKPRTHDVGTGAPGVGKWIFVVIILHAAPPFCVCVCGLLLKFFMNTNHRDRGRATRALAA